MKLSDIEVGKSFQGLIPNQIVEIIATKFYSNDAVEITYRTEKGKLGTQVIYAVEMEELGLEEKITTWEFTANADDFRLVSEAYRIKSAYLFETYLAVHTSLIEPLPHQISAVYEKMLPRQPLRFVLADDPGAGKTIMTGLLLKELILRSDVKRCLIVCPRVIAEQWKEELQQKFQLSFEILTGERINLSVSENIFSKVNLAIASLDTLSRHSEFKEKLESTEWDLIVCDEAHKMSATITGEKLNPTKRFRLGKLLGRITRHFLLLTATPHNGKEKDFYAFMSLIDPDRFEGAQRITGKVDVSDIMRRLVKEDLLTFEGKPLFPERIAYTVNYSLSPKEMELYKSVTSYVVDGFNRAENLDGSKKSSVGFAMTILQRRLASSPKAIYKSLERRTERLKKVLRENSFADEKNFDAEDWDENEEFPSSEFEQDENELADRATAAQTIAELKLEIQTLEELTEKAKQVFRSREDKKWQELSQLLQDQVFSKNVDEREKLIIFTEHRDTLEYLQERISELLGDDRAVVTIHGGLNFNERRNIEEQFKQNKNVLILVATDAAGEGINLQNAHLMINYDLSWNPNRLEQRFGRIHRIGQKKVCYLWNLVANETREGQVFKRLLEKLERERVALGGKVFDILGKISFNNKSLRDLLIEAIRKGNNTRNIRRLEKIIDQSVNPEKCRELLKERALTQEILSSAKVTDISLDMERKETFKLQPYCIEKFFVAALENLGGQFDSRGNGRYEIRFIPKFVREKNRNGETLPKSYESICFSKEKCNIKGTNSATLISLGHPLLENVTDSILEKLGQNLRKGTIFIDDNDEGQNFRLLFFVETAIQTIKNEQEKIISKKLHFVEILENGETVPVNYAPYLDYRKPKDLEREKILSAIQNLDCFKDVENIAVDYAVKNIIPAHLQEISKSRKEYLNKMEMAIRERLFNEIEYWDRKAIDVKEKNALDAKKFCNTADELKERYDKRLAEITLEKKISATAPVIIGGALIVPKGYFNSDSKGANTFSTNVDSRTKIEKIAMNAVMEIEKSLGNIPTDCSLKKCGYDVESVSQAGKFVRFIEVKGRTADADKVTITKNEILTALNVPEDFILALVRIDGNTAHVIYLKKPFSSARDLAVDSFNYNISRLIKQSEILLERTLEF